MHIPLEVKQWAAVDELAEEMHADGVRDLGGVPAPWSRCRKSTRQFWRREARRVLSGVLAKFFWR